MGVPQRRSNTKARGATARAAEALVALATSQPSLTDAIEALGPVPTEVLLHALLSRGDFAFVMEDQSDAAKEKLACALDSGTMLRRLAARGGHPGALAEAALLCTRKSEDYNRGMGLEDMHTVDRTGYFPFGAVSYAQMLHTKAMRFNSLVQRQLDGKAPNFEGLRDTALDLINYAGFFAADRRCNGRD